MNRSFVASISALCVATSATLACSGIGAGESSDAGTSGDPTQQERYTYPGCDDAGGEGCPRNHVFFCAIYSIEAKYRGCNADSDCAFTQPVNCEGIYSCLPGSVNKAQRTDFERDVSVEVENYCSPGGCHSSPDCSPLPGVPVPRCFNSVCGVGFEVDGGTDAGADAGLSDGGM